MRISTTAKSSTVGLLLKKGFTLIELLVSMGIIVMITSVALVQHNQFNETLALTNLAYEVGLSVRQAQVFGLSVREFTGSSGVTANLYGVHFDYIQSEPETRLKYVLYADNDGNNNFSGDSETVETTTITRGNYIDKFCATRNNSTVCSDSLTDSAVAAISSMSIRFDRPNPDAIIVVDNGDVQYEEAVIFLKSKDGAATRCVVVRLTGQVSIDSTCATP